MQKNITDAFVKKVKVKGLSEFWDRDVAGFFLRVTEAGTKTWAVSYRHLRRPRKFTIGKYPAVGVKKARSEAKRILGEAQLGGDPQAEKKARRDALTFGKLTTEYLTKYAAEHKRASSAYADKCMIESDLEVWKNRKAADISNRDVSALLDKIVRRGSPIKANRTLALLSKIFRYAIGNGLLERGTVSPTYLVPRPAKERSRERTLTDAEIKKLYAALAAQPLRVSAFFKLALLTGQRAREVLCMPRSEVDFEMGEWTIQAARAKNGREHLLPLSPTAITLIESLKSDHDFIFRSNRIKPTPLTEYKTWMDDIRVATGMTKSKGHPEHFNFHDLRRTLETNLTKMGISRFIADKITNHADASVGGIYDRYEYKNEKRDALAKWDVKLAQIVA